MKVHLLHPLVKSVALSRVRQALMRYAPDDIEFSPDRPNLTIIPVIGRQDRIQRQTETLNGRYAIIQFCVRSTMRPSTEGWQPLWKNAVVVWSYYDLEQLCNEDQTPAGFPFYHAPLGVDPDRFYPGDQNKAFVITTHGPSFLTESVREAVYAARRLNKNVFHLGPEMGRSNMACATGISDRTLAGFYSQSEFVAGLRRTEGFELPAAEGLFCGARPVMFDQPHYRQWFGDFAEFIPESPREQVIDDLETVFRAGARPVTEEERKLAMKRFDWTTIVNGFWERCLH